MAKPIRHINNQVPDPAREQAEAISDIVKALSANREAILTSLDILKNLQEMGALAAVHGLLEQRTEVGAIAIQQINQPAMQHVIKNAMSVFNFLGSLDPEQMQTIFSGLTRGLEHASERIQNGDNPSLWKLGTSIRNPEIKASLSTMLEIMQGLGEAFHHNSDKEQVQ